LVPLFLPRPYFERPLRLRRLFQPSSWIFPSQRGFQLFPGLRPVVFDHVFPSSKTFFSPFRMVSLRSPSFRRSARHLTSHSPISLNLLSKYLRSEFRSYPVYHPNPPLPIPVKMLQIFPAPCFPYDATAAEANARPLQPPPFGLPPLNPPLFSRCVSLDVQSFPAPSRSWRYTLIGRSHCSSLPVFFSFSITSLETGPFLPCGAF